MSLPVRIALLVGCGLVATLEAPQAGAWLSAGLSGPYARPAVESAELPPAARSAALPFAPVLFTLATDTASVTTTLAVGR